MTLVEGMSVSVYRDDGNEALEPDFILAEAVAHYDDRAGRWTFTIDRATIRHESEPDRGEDTR